MNVEYEGSKISMIINNSPLTRYHTLICPDVHLGLPQRICEKALRFCVDFLMNLIENGESNFRIGYNSPGALASVNHLHLHLMFIEQELYIDRAVSYSASFLNDSDFDTTFRFFLRNYNFSAIQRFYVYLQTCLPKPYVSNLRRKIQRL